MNISLNIATAFTMVTIIPRGYFDFYSASGSFDGGYSKCFDPDVMRKCIIRHRYIAFNYSYTFEYIRVCE